MTLLVLM